jgi:hypothetical protein
MTITIRDSSVGTQTGYELDDRGSITDRGKIYSLQSNQTDSEAHPAYQMTNERDFPWIKAAGA